MKEMYNEFGKRRLVFSIRKGTPYYTWRKFKSLKEGDVVMVDGVELSIIRNGEFEEFEFNELEGYIEAKLKETKRDKIIDNVLRSSPQAIREALINELLKDK